MRITTLQATYGMYTELAEGVEALIPIVTFLIIILIVNIIVEVIKIFGNLFVSKNELNSQKFLLREKIRIKVLEKLFQNLNALTLYDKSESTRMLEEIKGINQYIRSNQIYIPSKILNICYETIDYFNGVLTDYTKKDINKEVEFLQKFNKEFND